MNPLLEVRELAVSRPGRHGPVTLVQDVSLTVEPGSIVGLVGESGSGKSLTLKAISGLLPAGMSRQSSSINYQGRDISRLSSREMRRLQGSEIAMIFQEPSAHLSPVHTVGQQLSEVIRIHSDPGRKGRTQQALHLLEAAGIAEPQRRLSQYPHQLSGGLAQRVLIALALAGKPSLLLADEPTTALDVTVQKSILDTLLRLRDTEALSVVLVTHDLGVVSQVCDTVYVMYCGEIVEEGGVAEMFSRPYHPYTAGLIDSVPRLEDDILRSGIPGTVPAPDQLPVGCRFAARCSLCIPQCHDPVVLHSHGGRVARCVRAGEVSNAAVS